MAGDRTRSEYLLRRLRMPGATTGLESRPSVRPVRTDDREALARLLLAGYRGTIDDEGEGPAEALAAIDEYFSRIEWEHSVVLEQAGEPVSMACVVVVAGRHYIDPVVTAATAKGRGLGTSAVHAALVSLATAGVSEVGAVITDGNTASERLFASLGFERVGPWPVRPGPDQAAPRA